MIFSKSRKAYLERINGEVAQLKAFRDVGQTFNYLGMTCMVTGYYGTYLGGQRYAVLQADYVDVTGLYHHIKFDVEKLPCLRNQNPEASA
jgi:hypothetical protein